MPVPFWLAMIRPVAVDFGQELQRKAPDVHQVIGVGTDRRRRESPSGQVCQEAVGHLGVRPRALQPPLATTTSSRQRHRHPQGRSLAPPTPKVWDLRPLSWPLPPRAG
jgi:hypothetical protein